MALLINFLAASGVNMDAVETEDGELVAVLGMLTETGMTEFFIGKEGAEGIIQALTNYLDVRAGRPPSFPSPPPKLDA